MSTARDIIDTLGGSAFVSTKTGFPLTTIESWKTANFIPEWRQSALLALAKREKKLIRPEDFPPKDARTPRTVGKAAA